MKLFMADDNTAINLDNIQYVTRYTDEHKQVHVDIRMGGSDRIIRLSGTRATEFWAAYVLDKLEVE